MNYETVWSIVSMGTDLLAGLGDKGVYKSVNQGESWSPTSLTNHQVEVLYTKGNEVYAGGLSFINQGGIYKSTNNGGTWYSLGLNWETIYAITANDNYLFASVNNSGIFRTSNEGLSWIQVNTGLQTLEIEALEVHGTSIYAGTQGYGIYKSTNNGSNWVSVYNGFPQGEYFYVYDFLSSGQNLFACISESGTPGNKNILFMTTNDGVSWINKCQGLDTLIVGIFDLHLNNNYLYAAARVFCGQGDYGRSVWKRLFAEAINIKKIVNEIPSTIKIHQNYPNPFNPVTHIRIELPSTEMTLLKVFDISGKEIATLINERLNAGIYETLFEGTSLPSGVYFYKFSAGNFTETKKMILVK